MRFRLWHVPVRLATGAFILNSGINKLRSGDEEMHKGVHGLASGAYPVFEGMEPRTFTKVLGAGEATLGATLLAPFVGPGLAGASLAAFAGGLLGLYLRTPGMTVDGVRPSQQGTAMAKDSWLAAIGAALVIDAASSRLRRRSGGSGSAGGKKAAGRKAAKLAGRKAAKAAGKGALAAKAARSARS